MLKHVGNCRNTVFIKINPPPILQFEKEFFNPNPHGYGI
jgi:hypothetical protein